MWLVEEECQGPGTQSRDLYGELASGTLQPQGYAPLLASWNSGCAPCSKTWEGVACALGNDVI